MHSPASGLLFLHGHIFDAGLARRLAVLPSRPAGKRRHPPAPFAALLLLLARRSHGIGDGSLRTQ